MHVALVCGKGDEAAEVKPLHLRRRSTRKPTMAAIAPAATNTPSTTFLRMALAFASRTASVIGKPTSLRNSHGRDQTRTHTHVCKRERNQHATNKIMTTTAQHERGLCELLQQLAQLVALGSGLGGVGSVRRRDFNRVAIRSSVTEKGRLFRRSQLTLGFHHSYRHVCGNDIHKRLHEREALTRSSLVAQANLQR